MSLDDSIDEEWLAQEGYDLVRPLDRGGMGAIWVIRLRSLGEERVIKTIRRDSLVDDPERVKALFEREAMVASALSKGNDHIIKVLHYGVMPDQTPYSILPLYHGQSLQALCEPFKWAPGEIRFRSPRTEGGLRALVNILAGVADALDYMADVPARLNMPQSRYVHRDIKPANVLINEIGGRYLPEGVLSDFGLARAVDDLSLSKHPVVVGSAMYMAPEVWKQDGLVTPAADVYAFGAMVQHTLIGRPIFRVADERIAWARAHVNGRPETYAPRRRAMAPVADLIRGSLAKLPEDRPRASEWHQALLELLAAST